MILKPESVRPHQAPNHAFRSSMFWRFKPRRCTDTLRRCAKIGEEASASTPQRTPTAATAAMAATINETLATAPWLKAQRFAVPALSQHPSEGVTIMGLTSTSCRSLLCSKASVRKRPVCPRPIQIYYTYICICVYIHMHV